MDIKQIPIEKLQGMSVGFFSPMNGGKTESLAGELERALHSGYNVIAYNHIFNERDGDFLRVDGRLNKLPAKRVGCVAALKQDLERRIERIASRKVGEQGDHMVIEIDGISHKKHTPLVAVGIDEINLFCLNEKETQDMINFMTWAKKDNRFVTYVAGLLYDFRQRPFGMVHSLLPYLNIKEQKDPVCKSVYKNRQCGDPAMHTMRLWSIGFVKELGLGQLLQEMEVYNFADKSGKFIVGEYVPAPFFDKTVRIEDETKDGKSIYLPVCNSCSRLPYKDEVFGIYAAIIRGEGPSSLQLPPLLTERIMGFLSDPQEGWVREENGRFTPLPYYRNSVGGYSPLMIKGVIERLD